MTLSDDVNLEEFVMAKDELSGADIKAVCTEAGLLALRERRMRVTQVRRAQGAGRRRSGLGPLRQSACVFEGRVPGAAQPLLWRAPQGLPRRRGGALAVCVRVRARHSGTSKWRGARELLQGRGDQALWQRLTGPWPPV
jgi:SpoVK/Ycf46/Vps4 family AAA+-type ATPase